MHKDFEIYRTRGSDGKIRFAFNVEYFGYYICDTMETAEKKVETVRHLVKLKLQEIEKQNKAYYKKLERQQALFLKELHEAKHHKQKTRTETTAEIKRRKQIVRTLINKGYTNSQIMLRYTDIPLNSIVHIRAAMERAEEKLYGE